MQYTHHGATIASMVLLSLYNGLSAHRETFNRGLALFEVEPDELKNFHAHISLRRYVGIFEWLANALKDPWLGLKASQHAGPEAIGALGYLFLSSGNLETAVQSLSRYLEAVQMSSRIEISIERDLVQIRYRIIEESIAPRRQDSEYSIGLMWRYARMLSRNRCRLTQVSFEHEAPPGPATLPRRIFGAPVLFGMEANALTLPLSDYRRWHKELLDPHLFPILEVHIASTVSRVRAPATFCELVTRQLTEEVLREGAKAEQIARILKISTVTLHRRIHAEGCRFKALVEAKAKQVAERLLGAGSLPIATISSRLGFANPTSFNRTFRRWFDIAPREYRKHIHRQRQSELESGIRPTREMAPLHPSTGRSSARRAGDRTPATRAGRRAQGGSD